MAEETKNPMDLNGDGKVTLSERAQYYAGKAGEKIEQAAGKLKDEVKADAKEFGAKAADKAKDVYADAKEELAEAAVKAKAKVEEFKNKKA
jgi:hypothetical protein